MSETRSRRFLPLRALLAAVLAAALLAAVLAAAPVALAQAPPERTVVRVPAVDQGVDTLEARRVTQASSRGVFEVFNAFRFEDRQPESGITFRQHPTPDGLAGFKLVHYDHGNGVVAADVDADGRDDLYFVDQMGRNELWKNLGDGRFRDVTAEAGVALDDRVSVTASFADFDNDGDPDLFVTSVRRGNVLFENDGHGRFRDVTAKAGVGHPGHASGAFFFDYDRDGRLDLFVCYVGTYTSEKQGEGGYYVGLDGAFDGHLHPERSEPNKLFHNLGDGRFEDVSAAAGIEDTTWSGDASFADLNGDLYPDLYVLNMQGDDRYYENVAAAGGGRRFVDRSAELFPKTPWGSMGIKFFDFDLDGRLDLLLTDMHSDMSHGVVPILEGLKSSMTWTDEHLQGGANNIFGNAFYAATADGRFEERSDALGLENYWPWGVSVGDLNADGYEDVFIASSMSYPFRYGIDSLLINNRAQEFLGAEFILGVEPRRGGRTHIPWFTLDCSGADRAHPHCQGRDGQLEGEVEVLGALGTRSAVIFDLDGDGDLDIVTQEFHAEPQVLVSDLAAKTAVRYLEVDLQGKASNRDGLGAVVRVSVDGRTLTQQMDGKSGYLSQSSLPLYFGLGSAEKVDKVEVLWPAGRRQTVTEAIPVAGRLVVVEEGEAPAAAEKATKGAE